MGASFSLPKQWVNGEVLTHTELNAQFNTILDNVAVASGIASLDGSSLVVQNPVNATATPGASKIPIANGSGKLAAGWGGSASTLATLNSNTRLVEPALTLYDGSGNRSASATSGANIIPVADGSGDIHLDFIPDTLTGKTVATATSLAMTGESSAAGSPSAWSTATIDLGTVTAGDRIFVTASLDGSIGASNAQWYAITVSKSSGTATVVFNHNTDHLFNIIVGNTNAGVDANVCVSGIVQVSGSGTLVLQAVPSQSGGGSGISNTNIYTVFLKKQ